MLRGMGQQPKEGAIEMLKWKPGTVSGCVKCEEGWVDPEKVDPHAMKVQIVMG